MRITIFELNWNVYEAITDFLSSGWGDWLAYKVGDTVDVKLSNYTRFSTTGYGIKLQYMGRSVEIDRTDYNYIKIE